MRLFLPALGPTPYCRFHGMLCTPADAAACVASFNGTILFMPSTYDSSAFHASAPSPLPYEVTSLSVLKYYALVILSMTGLCSALRQTATIEATEDADMGVIVKATSSSELAVHPNVIDALARRHGSVSLVRRFEFSFRLIGLWVAMYHFAAAEPNGRETLSLVEVYKLSKVCVACAWAAAGLALNLLLRAVLGG